ncbi:MAG: hypothetical protein QOE69_174 [Thermoleophilaceae bacterium]|jgi:hypothetical protein|nr:hypothetical protein [Thermoleophilaceae bacterium]
MLKQRLILALCCVILLVVVVGCGGGSAKQSEAAAAATGDIPDNQVFLTYRGPGYSLKYPEGWAKSGTGTNLTFADKDNTIHLVTSTGAPPIPVQNGRGKVTIHRLGKPNPVTGKRPDLIIDRYVYTKNGRVAVLDLATPKGVDNVDAYRLISKSFRWR